MSGPIDVEQARRDRDAAVGDDLRLAAAELVLGAGLFESGDPGSALASFQRAEAGYRRVGLAREVGISRLNQARTLSALGRDAEAVQLYDEVSGNAELAELAWHGRFEHHEGRGETAAAEAALQEMRAAAAGGSAPPDRLAELDAALGRRRLEQEDAAGALPLLVQAAAGYAESGNDRAGADVAVLLGVAHHGLGDPGAAVTAFRSAAEVYRAHGDLDAAAAAEQNARVVGGS